MSSPAIDPDPVSALMLSPEQHRRILSTSRLKIALTGFVAALMFGLGVLMMGLVSSIFVRLNPSIRRDLEWKAERGAAEVSASAEFGMVLADKDLIAAALETYRDDEDIVAIVVTDSAGKTLATMRRSPFSNAEIFAGPARQHRAYRDHIVSWATASFEGNVVGRTAFVVSTERLVAGARVERGILITLGIGSLAGLLLSLLFVTFYVAPLIRVTQRAFDSLRDAALALAAKERLEKELEIGASIQTCLLPKDMTIEGLDIVARMRPATAVGGDYYDVIPSKDGGWIGIGDVAGHGLTAGLVMLMVQSAVSALTGDEESTPPREILSRVNRVIHDNVRQRLGRDEHVTLSLTRYLRDGRCTFAGSHEDIIVYRAEDRRCEVIPTLGPWVGARPDILDLTSDGALQLKDGDLMVLYTDGVTEAMAASRERFGLERLVELVEQNGQLAPPELLARIFTAVDGWMTEQEDDITAMVIRYHAAPVVAAAT
jgi:hypothetical protein